MMFVRLQWESWQVAYDLGLRGEEDGWVGAQEVFLVLEHIFNILFLAEMVVKIALMRCRYFREVMNIFDGVIVVASVLDAYILDPLGLTKGQNIGIVRLLRIFRVVRVFRLFRAARHLHDIR